MAEPHDPRVGASTTKDWNMPSQPVDQSQQTNPPTQNAPIQNPPIDPNNPNQGRTPAEIERDATKKSRARDEEQAEQLRKGNQQRPPGPKE